MPLRQARPALLALLALVCPALLRAQTTHTWTGPSPGEWGDYSNWSTFLVPNSGADAVVINNTSALPLTTTLGLSGSPFTARSLTATNTSPYSAIVLGTAANPGSQLLNLYTNSTTTSATPTIDVRSGLLQIASSITATQGFSKTGDGTLLLSGLTSGRSITLNGGQLDLAGTNYSNLITHRILPGTAPIPANATVSSTLRLIGPGALPANATLALDFGTQTMADNTVTATVDLGGLHRSLASLSTVNVPRNNTANRDSTVIIDFKNGSLETKNMPSFDLSSSGSGVNMEVRLPPSSTLGPGYLNVGNPSGNSAATKLNTGRVRIGTKATFRLYGLTMSASGSVGSIDALAPGSDLTLSGSNATSRVSSIILGNSGFTTPVGYDAGIDMETGTLNLLAGSVSLYGATSASFPVKTSIRFGNGTIEINNLELGGNPANAFDYQCLVVQKGGSAKISSLALAPTYSTALSGTRTHRYQLHGGTLELGNITGQGNVTTSGTLSRGIDWHGGTIQLVSFISTTLSTTGTGAITAPIDLALRGAGSKTLHVDANRKFILGNGSRISTDSASAILHKTGNGTLTFGGDSAAFTGTLSMEAGILSIGQNQPLFTAPVGAVIWNEGTIQCDLSYSISPSSDRLAIARTLTKGTASAEARKIQLNSLQALGKFYPGTYTLATYASTDLTPRDFTFNGFVSDYSTDFTVGPTSLTVTLAPNTAYSTWRRTKLNAASNLGSAADLADPDSDGRPNLLEYALASEPTSADSAAPLTLARLPASDSSPARLALTFNRIADPGLTYAVRAASSPSGPWTEVIFTSTGSDNTPGPITVTDPADLASHPTRFLRLFVTR